MRNIIGLTAIIALCTPLVAGCRNEDDNSDYVVSFVYGTYVECISAASNPFQVAIAPGTKIAVGDACPDGEHR